MDKLTCIYPVVDTAAGSSAQRACGYSNADLVHMQRHLRDVHLHFDAEMFLSVMRTQERWITHPNGTIGLLHADEPWNDQEYTKIEWQLSNGVKWLRAEVQP